MSTDDLLDEASTLARLSQEQVDNSGLNWLEPTVHLVTAGYAKDENGTTSGVSNSFSFNRGWLGSAPRSHFLNAELLSI